MGEEELLVFVVEEPCVHKLTFSINNSIIRGKESEILQKSKVFNPSSSNLSILFTSNSSILSRFPSSF
jgi:hypothetical protein